MCVGAGRACHESVEAAREKMFAGMARSYGYTDKNFSDIRLNYCRFCSKPELLSNCVVEF